MKTIEIHTPTQDSVITCEKGAFEKYVPALLKGHKNFLLTDSNVYEIYKDKIERVFGDTPYFVLPAGEESKNHLNLFKILEKMIEAELHRNSYLFALGGGVVGDIGGLAAALYMRGIHVVQIPTTLLSQVDSSVGGKTAVDMGKVKNVVGAFYQPERVLVDGEFLKTLPVRELRCGLGEIVKYGGLNGNILDKLTLNLDRLFDLDFLTEITPDCIEHKADVVRKDERESGLRKTLNMGHTTGHALELCYGDMSHGEFVLVGMHAEMLIAKAEGLISEEHFATLENLILKVMGKIPAYKNVLSATAYAKLDKKNTDSQQVSMIVPTLYNEWTELKLPYEKYAEYVKGFLE